MIGHWSDPPLPVPEAAASPVEPVLSDADKLKAAEGWMHVGIHVARLVAFFATPVLTPLIVSLNPDTLAGGLTLGIAMIGVGATLYSFVRRRNRVALRSDAPEVTLMGHRLPAAFVASGLLTIAPCLLLSIDFGSFNWVIWFAFGGLVALGIAGFVGIYRRQGVIAIDSFGIRFRDLWSNALPWSNIRQIRIESESTVDWLVFDLYSPLPASSRAGSLFSVRTRMNAERTALFVHWEAYQAHTDELAAYLQRRLRNYRDWAAERGAMEHELRGPDDAACALREMASAQMDE